MAQAAGGFPPPPPPSGVWDSLLPYRHKVTSPTLNPLKHWAFEGQHRESLGADGARHAPRRYGVVPPKLTGGSLGHKESRGRC